MEGEFDTEFEFGYLRNWGYFIEAGNYLKDEDLDFIFQVTMRGWTLNASQGL
ncbi:hypothetical protein ALP94_00957 [Pseudomonas savastanoi pv. glycinea]|nr:hypothetical protein ALP94_00957 [Pseudomonas savastanoi pv. glycinea]